nr:FMN reductase [Paraburkholderia sp.]
MRRLASGVCVLTSGLDGKPAGLTATAVTSLSADPPRLLACVNQTASAYATIEKSRSLCVNVLSADDLSLARCFAGMVPTMVGAARFAQGIWSDCEGGAPVLSSALVSFQCRVAEMLPAHTHSILICDVLGLAMRPRDSAPLIYVDGHFTSTRVEMEN